MTWPQGNIDSGRFDQDSDRISESRPELFKIAVATNQIANTFDPAGAEANNVLAYNTASSRFEAAGNITVGTVTASGTVTAGSFVGDGSGLTGLPAAYGNANVVTLLSNFGSNSVSTTGNITAGSFVGDGSQLTGLPPAGNSFSNVNANGTVLSADSTTDTLTITAGNNIVITGNASTDTLTISATANVITATDKVAGSFASGAVANTATEVKSLSVLIPANTFSAGDVIEIHTQWITTNGNVDNGARGEVWINTSDNVGGSQVRSFLLPTTSVRVGLQRIRFALDIISSSNSTRGFLVDAGAINTTHTAATGYGFDQINGTRFFNINWTINQYIILNAAMQQGATGSIQAVGYQIYKR
jgi:hypothetical protein